MEVTASAEMVEKSSLEARFAWQPTQVGLERVEDELEHVGIPVVPRRLARRREALLEADDVGDRRKNLRQLRIEQPRRAPRLRAAREDLARPLERGVDDGRRQWAALLRDVDLQMSVARRELESAELADPAAEGELDLRFLAQPGCAVQEPVEPRVPRQVAQRPPRLLVGQAEPLVQPPRLGDPGEERLDDGIGQIGLVVEGKLRGRLH